MSPSTSPDWHYLDVRCFPALERTSITLGGVLDMFALAAVDRAVRTAREKAHALSVDADAISSITPPALAELLTRGFRKGPGALLAPA